MLATPHPTGRAYTESRIAVDDGYIWPIERSRMVAGGAIRERMVEDIATAVNAGGEAAVVTLEDLRRAGWLPAQVEAHATTAFAVYKAQASPRRQRRATGHRDSVGRIAAEAAALMLFVAVIAFWSAIGTGVL